MIRRCILLAAAVLALGAGRASADEQASKIDGFTVLNGIDERLSKIVGFAVLSGSQEAVSKLVEFTVLCTPPGVGTCPALPFRSHLLIGVGH